MARGTFSSGNVLQGGLAPITAHPYTMAVWSRTSNVAANQTLLWIGDKDVAAASSGLRWSDGLGGAAAQAYEFGGGFQAATASGTPSNNTWHHVGGVFPTVSSRTGYLDGAAGTANTTTVTDLVADYDRVALGVLARSSPLGYLNGYVAWPAIWNVTLTTAEMEALAAGVHPYCIRPANLVFFALAGGSTGDEINLVGSGGTLTETGTVGTAESPLVALGWPSNVTRSAAAGGGATVPKGTLSLLGVGI